MKTLFALSLVVASVQVAFAQDAPPPPPPAPPSAPAPTTTPPPYPAPPTTPAPAPDPAPAPAPYPGAPAPAPYPGAPAPYAGAPAYGYPPPQQPAYTPPSPESLRNGLTFEANLGFGWMRIANDNDSDTSDLTLGGLDIGVGGWVNPHLALGARIAGVSYSENGARLTNGVLVGGLQYWANNNFWVGGGLGFGILALSVDDGDSDSTSGFGMDLRAGYTFNPTSENTFNVSFELTPTFLSENDSSATVTGIALLLGYQHL
jgi:hypothetical protein